MNSNPSKSVLILLPPSTQVLIEAKSKSKVSVCNALYVSVPPNVWVSSGQPSNASAGTTLYHKVKPSVFAYALYIVILVSM